MAEVINDRGGADVPPERLTVRGSLQHVSWGAIFLGLVIAVAFQILLGLFGLGLGFSIVDPSDPMGGIGAWGIATSIYVVVMNIVALFIGGYIAARLAPAITAQSAIFHGMSIWALATIVMVWLGTTTAGLAISGISSAVSGIGSAAGQAITAVIPEDVDFGSISYENLPEPVRETLRENNITPDDLQREVRAAFREVVSPQEQRQLIQELRQALQNILQNPASAPEQIERAIDDIVGEGGILTQQDMTQMQNTLQRRLNLSEQDVTQIVNQVQEGIRQAGETMKQAVETAQQQAIQAAETVSNQIGKVALWLALANVLGLIAAVLGGKLGEVRIRGRVRE